MAKSFFELAQKAARHRASKLLREVGEVPGGTNNITAGTNPNQQQAAPQATANKGTAATESPAAALEELAKKWPQILKDNGIDTKTLGGNQATQQLGKTFDGVPALLAQAVKALQAAQAKAPATAAPAAGKTPQGQTAQPAGAAGTQAPAGGVAKAPGTA